MNYDNITIPAATQIQNELREKLVLDPLNKAVTVIGGADISFNKFETAVYAGIVLLKFPEMVPVGHALAKVDVHFPYVPGYLAFREVPALLKAWELLPQKPDVLVVDGHGIAHPRRLGIAAHFGATTGQTSMGCAKKILYGKFEEPGPARGEHTAIMDKKLTEQIGWVLRSKNRVKPVFVSPGYGMDMVDSLHIISQCLGKYRIPEPTRLAHEAVNRFRRGELQAGYTEVTA